MLKVFLLVRAASTVTAQKVQHYIQFSHVPLALTAPITARLMQRLTLNHVVDEARTAAPINPCPVSSPSWSMRLTAAARQSARSCPMIIISPTLLPTNNI